MASRLQRTPFGEWWWTVDRLSLAALGALMLGGIILCLAASPPVATRIGLDPFHFVNRQVAVPDPRHRGDDRDLVPGAARYPPVGADRVRREPDPGRGDALFRRRDQGRAALAGDPRRQHPAVGIPQAGVRDPDRVAVRRIGAAPGNAGQHHRAHHAAGGRRAAGAAAGFRPDHADRAGLGRAVLHGRHALHLGAGARPPRRRRA